MFFRNSCLKKNNLSILIFFLVVTLIFFFSCALPSVLYIFKNKLSSGYEIGVDSSEGRTDWILDSGDALKMEYPSNQSWGVVYITIASSEDDPRQTKDLSAYTTLSVDLKGEMGGEKIEIGIKDKEDLDDGRETKIEVCDLTTDWRTIQIPLDRYPTADLGTLYAVIEIFFSGNVAQTVYFKNVKYMFANHDEEALTIYDGELSEGSDIGVNSSGNLNNWLYDENDFMTMEYPIGQSWGAVFVTVGPPTNSSRPSKDFSEYTLLSVDLKSSTDCETIEIGIKDRGDPDDGKETKIKIGNLSSEWETYLFPLEEFTTADLTNIYVPIEFVFTGNDPKTVSFSNIRYLD